MQIGEKPIISRFSSLKVPVLSKKIVFTPPAYNNLDLSKTFIFSFDKYFILNKIIPLLIT